MSFHAATHFQLKSGHRLPSGSSPMRRLYPTTSVQRMAVSLRCTSDEAMVCAPVEVPSRGGGKYA